MNGFRSRKVKWTICSYCIIHMHIFIFIHNFFYVNLNPWLTLKSIIFILTRKGNKFTFGGGQQRTHRISLPVVDFHKSWHNMKEKSVLRCTTNMLRHLSTMKSLSQQQQLGLSFLNALHHRLRIHPSLIFSKSNVSFRLSSSVSTPPPKLTIASRQALLRHKQQNQTVRTNGKAQKNKLDEKPWPRNIVLSFYTVCCIVVPYSMAWYVSSQEWLRSKLIPDEDYESDSIMAQLLHSMRHHFGEPDWASISEPERVNKTHDMLPYKFVDEPTAAVRRQQAVIRQLNNENITVGLIDANGTNYQMATLEASTLARSDDILRALKLSHPEMQIESKPLALEFPVSNDMNAENEEQHGDIPDNDYKPEQSFFSNDKSNDMSVYSLWHHHSTPLSSGIGGSYEKKMSDTEISFARLDYDIKVLQDILKSPATTNRSIDDIQEELNQKLSERRNLQWQKWLGR